MHSDASILVEATDEKSLGPNPRGHTEQYTTAKMYAKQDVYKECEMRVTVQGDKPDMQDKIWYKDRMGYGAL